MPIATAASPTLSAASAGSYLRASPANVGIKAIEIYVPNRCVDQSDLEAHDGAAPGKYVIGLGQKRMGFCDDREDIYSITLTAVSSLLKKYNIHPNSIGRLEVGTETLIDKSKSVKSVLMQLFSEHNTNIEGIDTINACYGGTNALFNAANWVESSSWDGRDAIVVAGDIAIYGRGAARPTGGAGAVAMLVGPNAPLALQPVRGSFMKHVYDFYKPNLQSEYPIVQGHYSLECYTRAIDACYKAYKEREQAFSTLEDAEEKEKTIEDRFDFMCFHSPTAKLVSKSFARLAYNDFKAQPDAPQFANIDPALKDMAYDASLTDRTVEKAFMSYTTKTFQQRVAPAMMGPTQCGNMYTASLYSGLASLLSNVNSKDLMGKNVGMFSYGSGLASTLFSLQVVGDTTQMQSALNFNERLDKRIVASPTEYEKAMWLREKIHLQNNYTLYGDISHLLPGTYYLTKIDQDYQRHYEIA
ncbi:hypothetical protein ASPWEDRAFT_119347 [Aspergillus wentii DTO 134E9]|uniref:Hydroxymethylglutaryl-CoA synthase n=1 Tax=Aspergillus wentii DTO 134E9 TaxID=1073089 RepID=A0A1L9R943_ASPWE|nr:uncharacterized protein ASPWEDRAFT_119347 [Aspergillus wentii DTO 134E9]KAI9926549.1 Hydroxymethylglutaryl-CoA synthase, cytoplasmic [Aspergillus wentii]OJJ31403.1 hypothetical protein ASPWEDRAFT_119347 [Aspergillus wentii DTO 134E9]